jgi:antitoxin (DNA-binding transcriptional repressor) of toxin-antitoxin stability system
MMMTVSIPEAQATLPEIVEKLKPGEEVILTDNQQPVAKLIPFAPAAGQPVFGSCRGKLVVISEDEEHLEAFNEYGRASY